MLSVETVAIGDPGPLLDLAEPRHPLAFVRRSEGLVARGEAVRLEFRGAGRIADAASAWRALVADAVVTDPIGLPGTGLVALGSFAFADDSAATSVLIVPSTIYGRRDGVTWRTTVTGPPPARDTDDRPGEYRPIAFAPGALDPDAYRRAVATAIDRIESGSLHKAVLARDLVGRIDAAADLVKPLRVLADTYPDTFVFAIDQLLGASPETLVGTAGGIVTARVLAGTVGRGADGMSDTTAAATLAASRKDVAEHEFALASVLAALGPLTSRLRSSAHPFALKLPNLWHLASDVSGALESGSSALDLVAALHPTAAVAGDPCDQALAAIADLEPFDRGRYAGPVGWVDANGDGEWAVALRCAQVAGDTVTAYAGAGIVAGSHPDRELAETTLKFRPIVEAFG